MESPEKKPLATLTQIYGENINRKFMIRSKVTIGRSVKAHIRLTNPNISRNHCSLSHSDKGWEIVDEKSQNGTYICGKRLKPGERGLLQCGDIIFLGPPSEMPEAFCFDDTFLDEVDDVGAINVEPEVSVTKRSSDPEVVATQRRHSTEKSFVEVLNEVSKVDGPNSANSLQAKVSGKSFLPKLTSVKVGRRTKKEVAASVKGSVLSKAKHSSSISEGEDIDQINEISSTADDQVESSPSLLYSENEGATDQVFSPGSSEVLSRGSEPTSKDTDETEALKSKLAKLSAQVKKLQESETNLLNQKKSLVEKLDEQDKLKNALESKAKDEVKNELFEKFEEDLICNICTELLIKPTVLDCSHTFCLYCIEQWKKKKSECPICRNRIQNMTSVLTLEHFIDKALSTLTPEQRDKRNQMIKEREKLQKEATLKKRKKPKASPYRRHTRPRIAPHPHLESLVSGAHNLPPGRSGAHSFPRSGAHNLPRSGAHNLPRSGGLNFPSTSHESEIQVIADRRNIVIPYPLNPFIQHMNFRVPEVLLSDSEMDSSISIYIS